MFPRVANRLLLNSLSSLRVSPGWTHSEIHCKYNTKNDGIFTHHSEKKFVLNKIQITLLNYLKSIRYQYPTLSQKLWNLMNLILPPWYHSSQFSLIYILPTTSCVSKWIKSAYFSALLPGNTWTLQNNEYIDPLMNL